MFKKGYFKKQKQSYRRIKKRGLLSLMFYFVLAISFLCAIFLLLVILYTGRDLPQVQSLKNYKSNFTTRIYSREGELLNNYANENRIYIAIDDIPNVVKEAFIAAEDANFYLHNGIDINGIIKAVFKNIIYLTTGNGTIVGASTITQQTVKNILLSNERTITRKIKEALLAIEASKIFSKDEILEMYLNHIFLGSNAYGVMAASIEYFGKSIKDVTVEEAALLAALPKAPSDINPRKRKKRALERRNWVLQRMLENNFITKDDYKMAIETPINVVNSKRNDKIFYGVNSFSDYVKTLVSSTVGSEEFFSGGYYIHTTLDYNLQRILYKAFRNHVLTYDKKMGYRKSLPVLKFDDNACLKLNSFIEKAELHDITLRYAMVSSTNSRGLTALNENCEEIFIPEHTMQWANQKPLNFKKGQIIVFEYTEGEYQFSQMPEVNGGAIIINPHNGEVLAMIGDFYDRPNGFNRAIFAKRQLGSAAKPFVYLTALENGFTPASGIVDEDLKLADEWQPQNSSRDFLGLITLRVALERSRNIPTVRLAEMIGINKIIRRFENFGLNVDKLDSDLTTVLGSFSVTVERTAKAFSTFVNKGRKPETKYIIKVQNREGKVLLAQTEQVCNELCFSDKNPPVSMEENQGEQVANQDVSFQVLSILEGATQRGTASGLNKLFSFGVAGKTGSTNDHKDAWFVGMTNELTTVIYLGNDKPKSLGENQYGAVLALPIFRDVIYEASPFYQITEFEAPKGIERIKIDYYTGEIASEDSKRTIFENFKPSDRRPKKPLSRRSEEKEEVSIESLKKQLDEGVY